MVIHFIFMKNIYAHKKKESLLYQKTLRLRGLYARRAIAISDTVKGKFTLEGNHHLPARRAGGRIHLCRTAHVLARNFRHHRHFTAAAGIRNDRIHLAISACADASRRTAHARNRRCADHVGDDAHNARLVSLYVTRSAAGQGCLYRTAFVCIR